MTTTDSKISGTFIVRAGLLQSVLTSSSELLSGRPSSELSLDVPFRSVNVGSSLLESSVFRGSLRDALVAMGLGLGVDFDDAFLTDFSVAFLVDDLEDLRVGKHVIVSLVP